MKNRPIVEIWGEGGGTHMFLFCFSSDTSSVFGWDFNSRIEIRFRFQFKFLKGQLFTGWNHSLLFPERCFTAGGRWSIPFCAVHKLPWSTSHLPSSKMYSQGLAARCLPAWKLWQTCAVRGGVWLEIALLRQAEIEGDWGQILLRWLKVVIAVWEGRTVYAWRWCCAFTDYFHYTVLVNEFKLNLK